MTRAARPSSAARRRRWPLAPSVLLLLGLGCGYTLGAPGAARARNIHLAPLAEGGLDPDAGAMVAGALRRAVARGPGTRLAAEGPADGRLEVELLDLETGLQPFADLAARAAQYRQLVRLRGTLYAPTGEVLWRSEPVTGEALYLSPPGGVEALEGARRRALAQAAVDAAERLVASLRWGAPSTSPQPSAAP